MRDIEHAEPVETAQVALSDRGTQRVVTEIEPLQLLHAQEQGTVQTAQLVMLKTQILDIATRDVITLLLH